MELQSALRKSTAHRDYFQRRHAIREIAQVCTPSGSIIAVVSKGDDELIDWPRRCGWHFPRQANGDYAGYHPADSQQAIAHLEELRNAGATHLLIPKDAFWWLEFYAEFTQHLQKSYRLATYHEGVCIIYRLAPL